MNGALESRTILRVVPTWEKSNLGVDVSFVIEEKRAVGLVREGSSRIGKVALKCKRDEFLAN